MDVMYLFELFGLQVSISDTLVEHSRHDGKVDGSVGRPRFSAPVGPRFLHYRDPTVNCGDVQVLNLPLRSEKATSIFPVQSLKLSLKL